MALRGPTVPRGPTLGPNGVHAHRADAETSRGPAQIMAWMLFVFSGLLAIAVFGANSFNAQGSTVLYAVSLAVAIIPEGLVAVVTVTLAYGMKVMSRVRSTFLRPSPSSLRGVQALLIRSRPVCPCRSASSFAS